MVELVDTQDLKSCSRKRSAGSIPALSTKPDTCPYRAFCFYIRFMFYTYILQSVKSGRYYIGHTSNIEERLERHNTGKVDATKNKGSWTVKYFETYKTESEANSRELYIKSMKSRIFIEKLISNSTAN
jgi:putative endonuclease